MNCPKMANHFLVLLAAMLIGWSSATSLSRVRRDDSGDTTEEQRSLELIEHFKGVSDILRKALGRSSDETALLVGNYDPDTDTRNPEELGTYFEGDILWPLDESNERNGLVANSSRWPNGIIPFRLSEYEFEPNVYRRILRAIRIINTRVPCLKFVPHTMQTAYVTILNGNGCFSSVGYLGYKQYVSLQSPGCTEKYGTIFHELMHTIGFLHEHNREDRDNYVDIYFENVEEGKEKNFRKVAPGLTTTFGIPYTYSSVMHYSMDTYSKNGNHTIVPKPDPDVVIGQRERLDPNDVKKMRAMYGCPASRT